MSIKASLRSYLTSDPMLTAGAVGGVHPVALPQDRPRPAITYQRMPSDHDANLKGATGSSLATFRIVTWADSYSDAETVSEYVRKAMQGFSGNMNGTQVGSVTLANDYDDYTEPPDGSAGGIFQVVFDFHIRYSESVPAPGL